MNKILTFRNSLLLVLLLTVASSFSYAGTTANDLSHRLKISFRRDFKNATFLGSEIYEKTIKVTLSMDNTILWAYYTIDGKLLGVVHNICSTELPESLKQDLKEGYSDYWIKELFELKGNDGTYYVSLENANETLNLHSTEDGGWEVYSRVKKS